MAASDARRAIGRGAAVATTLLGVLVAALATSAGAQGPGAGGGQEPPPRPRPAQEKGKADAPDIAEQFQVDDRGLVHLHANELDVRQALELISRQGAMNILVSPGVSGTVTINLEGATIEQALDAVAQLGAWPSSARAA